MIGRLIHNAIHRTALKVVLAPVVGAVYVGYKATKIGIDAANKGLGYIDEYSSRAERAKNRAEQAKKEADPAYQARKEQEAKERQAKEAFMAAWRIELQRRQNERRCLSCGKGLRFVDKVAARNMHKDCIGKEAIWNVVHPR